MQKNSYVLWLASWYPNRNSPFEGDFVQRHARAASLFSSITVFYVCKKNLDIKINYEEKRAGSLSEILVYVHSFKTGIKFIDAVLYNIKYFRQYRRVLLDYFEKHGKPKTVHLHVPMKAGIMALWLKRKFGIPFIVTEHSGNYEIGSSDYFLHKTRLYRNIVRKIFRESFIVTNVSFAFANKLKKLFDLSIVKVIYNTVDISLFNDDDRQSPVFRFIHVSMLLEDPKNISGIIRTAKRLAVKSNNFELVVVGPASNELVEDNKAWPFIKFTGEISYEAVAKEMKKASAFILFSWRENSPCVICEALCCGLPVIATNVGGITELVDETSGVLILPGREDDLLIAMENIMDQYLSYNKEMIANNAAEKFSFDVIGKEFDELYDIMDKK